MRADELPDAIPLVPYQVTNFLVQEQWISELAAQASTRRATDSDPFLENTLARAWYRNRTEDRDNGARSSDEVGGQRLIYFSASAQVTQSSADLSEFPKQRSSTRKRFSSTRIPSTVTSSSSKTSSKTSSSRASSSKVTLRTETTRSPFIPSGHWTKKKLQEQWDKATKDAGSASVTIVNEVDGEEVPGVPEDFQYLEHGYDWGRYAPDPNFLIGCDCAGNCGTEDTESCCVRHIDSDPEGFMGFWYDKWVRFPCEYDMV